MAYRSKTTSLAAVALTLSALAMPAMAQQDKSNPTPDAQSGETSSKSQPAPAAQPSDQGQAAAPAAPAAAMQVPGPTATPGLKPSPNLVVATVKLEDGVRASKMIGANVYNDQNQQVGTVDDIILDHDNKAVLAVLSVGGFLGVGGKLVAVGYTQLHEDNTGKVILPDASKDALNKMPSFTYGT
jgi:hypothetical protein